MTDVPVSRPPTETIGKISANTLGAPQGALADENINKATMGHIIGLIIGTKTATKEKPNGEVEVFTGLRGSFKAVPISEKKPEYRSAVLYLPAGLDEIVAKVVAMEKAGDPVMVKMAAEMFVVRAKNPAGYSWGLRSMLPPDASTDPLAELEAQLKPAPALTHDLDEVEAPKDEPEEAKVPAGKGHKAA